MKDVAIMLLRRLGNPKRSARVVIYFATLFGAIILVNTALPRLLLSAAVEPSAAASIAQTFKGGTRDLVLLFLVSLYFEWAKSREQVELIREVNEKVEKIVGSIERTPPSAIRQLAIQSTSADDLAAAAFEKHVGGNDVQSLVSRFLSDRPVYRDVSAATRLERLEGDVMVMKSECSFIGPTAPLLFAAVQDTTEAAALLAACPHLFDLVTLPASERFEESVRYFGDSLHVYIADKLGRLEQIPFRALLSKEWRQYISLPIGVSEDKVVIFGPDRDIEQSNALRVRYVFEWKMGVSDHFLYWCTNRLMFVRSLTLDVRILVSERSLNPALQPFLGDTESLTLDFKDGYLALFLDRWIIDGQGVVIAW